jgi:hypothetical protein
LVENARLARLSRQVRDPRSYAGDTSGHDYFNLPDGATCLAENFASMAHSDHVCQEFFVKQVAYNTKFTDTVTPCMRITLHGFALVTRVTLNKFFEEVENPALYLPV